MNFKLFITLGVATTTVSILAILTSNQSTWAQTDLNLNNQYNHQSIVAQSRESNGVRFFCQETFEPISGTKIPATIAWVPQRQKNISVIYWQSDDFSQGGWTPQARCEEVSPKFQTFYKDGRLNYLTHGKIGVYSVVCAVVEDDETCNGDNQLFTVNPNADAESVLLKLKNVTENASNSGGRLYLSSGSSEDSKEKVYVHMKNFLLNAPAAED